MNWPARLLKCKTKINVFQEDTTATVLGGHAGRFLFNLVKHMRMKAFWKLTTVFLAGVIAGVVLWEKIGANTVFKGAVRIKQKGKGNVLDADIKPEIKAKTTKAQRILDRLENKKAKAQKKLDKQHAKDSGEAPH